MIKEKQQVPKMLILFSKTNRQLVLYYIVLCLPDLDYKSFCLLGININKSSVNVSCQLLRHTITIYIWLAKLNNFVRQIVLTSRLRQLLPSNHEIWPCNRTKQIRSPKVENSIPHAMTCHKTINNGYWWHNVSMKIF